MHRTNGTTSAAKAKSNRRAWLLSPRAPWNRLGAFLWVHENLPYPPGAHIAWRFPLFKAGLTALVLAAGCRSAPPTSAVIPRTTGMSLWEPEHAGATAAAVKYNMRVYWNAPTREDDVQGQLALVQQIIDKGYAGLVLAPDQTLALMTLVRRGLAKDIPTVIVGTALLLKPGGKLAYILSDDEKAGRLAAQRIGLILHGKGSVAILGIDPDISGVLQRVRSFESTLAQEYSKYHNIGKENGVFQCSF